jgi:hypothetical protein
MLLIFKLILCPKKDISFPDAGCEKEDSMLYRFGSWTARMEIQKLSLQAEPSPASVNGHGEVS